MLVLGDAEDAGHWRLQDLTVGERFAFGGRVFDTEVLHGDRGVRATGDVLGRVYDTHVRWSNVAIDLVVSGPEGPETITGTPEHPFWVDAVGDYVAMGELEVGTVLRTVGGGESVVVAVERRNGDFQVFNFEVEWLHNYFVSAPSGGDTSVLVHNGCGTQRVRHFTNKKGKEGIKTDGIVKASDQNEGVQNSVFTVKAKGKPGSPRDVEEKLGIKRGRGNHYVEFEAKPSEFEVKKNPKTGARERVFKGDVDLDGRSPTFHDNK